MSSDGIYGAPAGLKASAGPAGLEARHTAVQLAIYGVLQRSGNRIVRRNDDLMMDDAIEILMTWVAEQQDDAITAEDAFTILGQIINADGVAMSDSFTVMTLLRFNSYARPGEFRPGASRPGAARNALSGSFLNINIDDVLGMADDASAVDASFLQGDAVTMSDTFDATGSIPSIDDGMSSADEAISSSSDSGPQTDDVITMSDVIDVLATQDVADAMAAADTLLQDGYVVGIDDTMAAADAVTSDGSASVADAITAVDATTLLGTMSAADAITATDAQAALGTIADVADGITATDGTSYTSTVEGGAVTVALLHLSEGTFNTRPSTVVNSISGGPTFSNRSSSTVAGGYFWYAGTDCPFGQGMQTEAADGWIHSITALSTVTFAADFCMEGFTDSHFDGYNLLQFSENGNDSGAFKIRLQMDNGTTGGTMKLTCFAKSGAGAEFVACVADNIAPLAGVAGMTQGYHYAMTREAGILTIKANGTQRAASASAFSGSLTGYLDMFGSYDRVSDSSNGGWRMKIGELRAVNGSGVYGSAYTVPTARFTG